MVNLRCTCIATGSTRQSWLYVPIRKNFFIFFLSNNKTMNKNIKIIIKKQNNAKPAHHFIDYCLSFKLLAFQIWNQKCFQGQTILYRSTNQYIWPSKNETQTFSYLFPTCYHPSISAKSSFTLLHIIFHAIQVSPMIFTFSFIIKCVSQRMTLRSLMRQQQQPQRQRQTKSV